MMNLQTKPGKVATRDAAGLLAVFAVCFALYLLLMQAAPTLDGIIYMHEAWAQPPIFNHYHMLYVPLLGLAMDLGVWAGDIPAQTAGSLLSALLMAVAVALFYWLLRRAGIPVGLALTFTLLFGLANPVLENATSVEIYAPALVAIMLATHAFWREMERPGTHPSPALLAACLLVALLHTGFCLWILAVYLTLAWMRRRQPRRAVICLLHGGAILVILLGVIALAGPSARTTGDRYAWIFQEYFNRMTPWRMGLRLLAAPMSDVAFNMGLALFPALAGWILARRRWPALALLTAMATLFFLGFYSFWIVDCGNFYLPLLPLWGLLAAAAAQALIERGPAGRLAWFYVMLAVGGGVFLFALSPPLTRNEYDPLALSGWWIAGFYAWLVLTARPLAVGREGIAARRGFLPVALFAVLALGLQGAAYLPRLVEISRFGDLGPIAAALLRIDPLPVNSPVLITVHHKPGALAQTRLPTGGLDLIGAAPAAGQPTGRPLLAQWVLATARPGRPLHLWLDAAAMAQAREHWNEGAGRDIPLELLDFEPHHSEGYTFYRVRFRDPAEGRRRWNRSGANPD